MLGACVPHRGHVEEAWDDAGFEHAGEKACGEEERIGRKGSGGEDDEAPESDGCREIGADGQGLDEDCGGILEDEIADVEDAAH